MKMGQMLYEGKAKQVFATEDENLVIVHYKDDATAFNGQKKGTIMGKGAINNRVSNHVMMELEKQGIATHVVEELNERDTIVKKVSIVPLEVIIRNVAAGSFSARYGVPEGTLFDAPTFEFSYKNDDLNDPLINHSHALAMKLATKQELATIEEMAYKINDALKAIMDNLGLKLIDFKLEFGRLSDGTIVLADEISPDTCRLWDKQTNQKLDKDRFRRNLGGVEEAYQEIARRLLGE